MSDLLNKGFLIDSLLKLYKLGGLDLAATRAAEAFPRSTMTSTTTTTMITTATRLHTLITNACKNAYQ